MGLLLLSLLALVGCDVELGHEDHDHDGDGEQDHAAEDHDDEHDDLSIISDLSIPAVVSSPAV